MIREALGILGSIVAVLGALSGFAETHPILCLAVVGISAWGLS